MASRYYIRFRGRKLGPLTVERLHALAKRGRFARHYEVSTDGKQWLPAADFPELFADSAGADDGFGDGFDGDDEMPEDPWADDDEPRKKKGKTRRRQKTRSSSFTPPPPPPIDDTPIDSGSGSDEPKPGRRRTIRTTTRSPAAADDGPIVEEDVI